MFRCASAVLSFLIVWVLLFCSFLSMFDMKLDSKFENKSDDKYEEKKEMSFSAETNDNNQRVFKSISVSIDASKGPSWDGYERNRIQVPKTVYGHNFVLWQNKSIDPSSEYWYNYDKMVALTKLIKPGVIRFPGGGISDEVYFDRSNTYQWFEAPPGTEFIRTLRADTIDDYIAFCREVGAEPLIELPSLSYSTAMDIVRYCNVEHNYNVKFFEMGNKPELATYHFFKTYLPEWDKFKEGIRSYDPKAQLLGPSCINPYVQWPIYLLQNRTSNVEWISFQYFPCIGNETDPEKTTFPTIDNLLRYSSKDRLGIHDVDIFMNDYHVNLEKYSPNTKIAVTELSALSLKPKEESEGGIHNLSNSMAYAVWVADMVPRLAERGVTLICQWMLQSFDLQRYSLINGSMFPHPAYYTYLIFARWWGDILVDAISDLDSELSVHATLDSTNSSRMWVLLINRDTSPKAAHVSIKNFNAFSSGEMYSLTAPEPASVIDASINGVQLDIWNLNDPLSSIVPKKVNVGNDFNIEVPPFSVNALLLTGELKEPFNEPPHAPQIIGPKDWAIVQSITPTLECTPVEDPDGGLVLYHFLVDNDPDFSSPIVDDTIPSTKYKIAYQLPDGGYYWKVQAIDGSPYGKGSEFSVVQTFTVARDKIIPPTAYFTIDTTNLVTGSSITINASSSEKEGMGRLDYWFDFGDGTNSGWVISSIIKHIYRKAGTYIVKVKVRDELGQESPWTEQKLEIKDADSLNLRSLPWMWIIIIAASALTAIYSISRFMRIKKKGS